MAEVAEIRPREFASYVVHSNDESFEFAGMYAAVEIDLPEKQREQFLGALSGYVPYVAKLERDLDGQPTLELVLGTVLDLRIPLGDAHESWLAAVYQWGKRIYVHLPADAAAGTRGLRLHFPTLDYRRDLARVA